MGKKVGKKKNPSPAKMGRPSKKELISLEKVELLASMGLTEVQIAKVFGVCEATISNYKIKWPDFLEAIKSGKEVSDDQVVKSLFHRACGYTHPETKVFCNSDGDVTQVDVTKQYPPDPTSMIFWLKNRRPDLWRDKQEVEHSGDIVTLTQEEKDARVARAKKAFEQCPD